MSGKAIAVIGLSALALALALALAASGCGGGSESEVEKFASSFEERFGETSWYGHITGMKLSSGNLEITTDLDSPSDAGHIERGICGRAAKLALDLGVLGDGFEGVVMTGSDGVELGGCG